MTDARHHLDRELRALLDQSVDPARAERAIASARLRMEAAIERDAMPRIVVPMPARTRLRPVRVLVVAAAVAIAAMVAVAIDPFRGSGPDRPTLAPNASAAETLQWAGRVLDPVVGTGSVVHTVRATNGQASEPRVEERWLDLEADRHRTVTVRFDEEGAAAGVWIAEADGPAGRQRTYSLVDGEWIAPARSQRDRRLDMMPPKIGGGEERVYRRTPDGRLVPEVPATGAVRNDEPTTADPGVPVIVREGPAARSGGDSTLEAATRTWISAVSDTTDPEVLLAATEEFQASTRGFFVEASNDDTPATRNATTIRQLVHLLSSAPVSAQASRFLYEELADFDELQRLDDTSIDGRRAARIQFTGFDIGSISPTNFPGAERQAMLERLRSTGLIVLLVDLEDGRLLGTETLDGTTRSHADDVGRVPEIGAGRRICEDIAVDVPCSLLDGTHPAARAADVIASTPDS